MHGKISFFGDSTAELFTRELDESLSGVLERNFIRSDDVNLNGFVTASIDGRPWYDTMWSRDAGVFLRELVSWGYIQEASLLAENLIRLVRLNPKGYYTFPMYFKMGCPGQGSELDGTCSVIIGLALLWERVDAGAPVKEIVEEFLFGGKSPLYYITEMLEGSPLIPGSGEFGGGMGVDGEYYNAVQNFLVYYALTISARIAGLSGNERLKNLCEDKASGLIRNIERYFIGSDNTWTWCVDTNSLKPDQAVLNAKANKGFSGINGIAAMYGDVLGLDPCGEQWPYAAVCEATFDRLLNFPKSREQYDKYGIYIQFQSLCNGLLTSPSYGQGYALQTSLLLNRFHETDKLIAYLTEATYKPPAGYKLDRYSGFHFYERLLSPDYFTMLPDDREETDQGCGALNLVNVAEPLKIARLIAGIDDTSSRVLRIIPRLPEAWQGVVVSDWPVLCGGKLLTLNMRFERNASPVMLSLSLDGIAPMIEVILYGRDGSRMVYKFYDCDKLDLELN